MQDDSSFSFNTQFNYLKRHQVFTVTRTGTASSGTIAHGLPYLPAVRCYFLVNGKMYQTKGNSTVGNDEGVLVLPRYTSSSIAYNISSSSSKTVTLYFIVYIDDIS